MSRNGPECQHMLVLTHIRQIFVFTIVPISLFFHKAQLIIEVTIQSINNNIKINSVTYAVQIYAFKYHGCVIITETTFFLNLCLFRTWSTEKVHLSELINLHPRPLSHQTNITAKLDQAN